MGVYSIYINGKKIYIIKKVIVKKIGRLYCIKLNCLKHTKYKITQIKSDRFRNISQGKRRYDNKQNGFGSQTKPVLKKKTKITKKIVLKLQCCTCKFFS